MTKAELVAEIAKQVGITNYNINIIVRGEGDYRDLYIKIKDKHYNGEGRVHMKIFYKSNKYYLKGEGEIEVEEGEIYCHIEKLEGRGLLCYNIINTLLNIYKKIDDYYYNNYNNLYWEGEDIEEEMREDLLKILPPPCYIILK